MLSSNPVLIGFELVAASIWIGSLACLAVVSAATRRVLDTATRVAFFRELGRRYGILGTVSLAALIGLGLTMIWPPSRWGRLEDTSVALAGVLVAATAVGIRQAQATTRLRRRSLDAPADTHLSDRVRRSAKLAMKLRGGIALITLAEVVVVAWLIGN